MAAYSTYSSMRRDGLYFDTILNFPANSLFGRAICLVYNMFSASCNRNVDVSIFVPFTTSGPRELDSGNSEVNVILNPNGLTFSNNVIRRMGLTQIQLLRPAATDWQLSATFNTMAVYLPGGFQFNHHGITPIGWEHRFDMTIQGSLTAERVSLGVQITIPNGGWVSPLGLRAFTLHEVSITVIRYFMGSSAFDMQLTSRFDLAGESFTVGVQFPLPITPPVTYTPSLAQNFGLFFSADTQVTARDALRIAQTIRLGQVLVDPPAFLDSIAMNTMEVCIAPNSEVEFWISDSNRDTTCGPGMRGVIAIQILSLTATFTVQATMNSAALATNEYTHVLLQEAAANVTAHVERTGRALTTSEEVLLHAARHDGPKHIQMLMAHPAQPLYNESMYDLIVKHHPDHTEFHPDNIALWEGYEGGVGALQGGGAPTFGGGSLSIVLSGVDTLINDAVSGMTNLILGNNANWNWLRNAITAFFNSFNIRSISMSHTMSPDGAIDLAFNMGLTIGGNLRDLSFAINFDFTDLLSILQRMGSQLIARLVNFPAPPYPRRHVCLRAEHCTSNICRLGFCSICSAMGGAHCRNYGRFACDWTPTPNNCAGRSTSIRCPSNGGCTWTQQRASCASRWNGRRPASIAQTRCSCSRYGGGWPRRVRCTGTYVVTGAGSCSGTNTRSTFPGSCTNRPNTALNEQSIDVNASAFDRESTTGDNDVSDEAWNNATAADDYDPAADEAAAQAYEAEQELAAELAENEAYQRDLLANSTDPTEMVEALEIFGLIAHELPDWDMQRVHTIMAAIGAHEGEAVPKHEWVRAKHAYVIDMISKHSEEMRVEKASRPPTENERLAALREQKLTYGDLLKREAVREAASKIKVEPLPFDKLTTVEELTQWRRSVMTEE